uniref:Predicted protein n=1 Tax=Hordeum vulgare subsp. vulgare TaxID=112509 RepID=F2E6J6_HORVV|nr:predicted protein [Hordeum vulgare subsp. vulgare]
MESARKIWSFARCGDGRLMNEQLEALQKKSTENTPLPLQLKLNLQRSANQLVEDHWFRMGWMFGLLA